MSPEDFRQMGRGLLGKGWQTRLSDMLGVDGSTIRRWVGTGMAVPPTPSAYLSMMAERQSVRGALVFERQRTGAPIHAEVREQAAEYEKLPKPLRFPGTPDPKRMPSIHAETVDDVLVMALRDDVSDQIATEHLSFTLTRHPDPWHLEGYRAAALAKGHATASVKYGDHHYSLLAHLAHAPPMVLHHIATHQAVNRIAWSSVSSPEQTLYQELF